LPGGDRDADDDAADQGRCGQSRGGEVVLAGDSYDEAYATRWNWKNRRS
jgi:hypothetical protein